MFGHRILILVPHPDDEVVGCGAAIQRARRQGAEVFGLYLTTGVPEPAVLWPWQRSGHAARVGRRRREAEAAAALLGLRALDFLPIATRRLKDNLGQALAAARRAVAAHAVDTVWVPAYEGGHQDHDSANCLAQALRGGAEVWEFSEYNLSGGRVQAQAFPSADGSERTLALSAAETALKRQALALYPSETGNLGYVGTARECFRPLPARDYAQPPHSGKTFYQRFHWVPFRHPRIDFTTPEEVCAVLERFRDR